MEESISFLDKIKQMFSCEEQDIRTYSPLTLAFIGDCIFDLIIRTVVVERGNRATESLHKKKSMIVKAETQSKMIESIQTELSETELAVYKRGRNAKSFTSAKNASIADYRKATGMEALLGYFYLTGQEDRMLELVKKSLENTGLTV